MNNKMIITRGMGKFWVEYPDGHVCAVVNEHEEAIAEAERAIASGYATGIDDKTRDKDDEED